MAELQTINESGDLTEIKLGGTTDGDKILTSDEIDAKDVLLVPYTGATTNVDLGDNTLDTKRLLQSNNGNSIFIGENSGLNDDLTDNRNVLIGYNAGVSNTGIYSNGFGANALQENTGIYSNGFGSSALLSNTGDNSNGVGSSALANNTGASSNGVGANALQENTGDNSNGFGSSALENNTGANNTAVGHNTSSSDPFAFTNTTALGYNVQPNASNQVMLGDTNVTDVYLAEDGTATANIGKIQLAALNTAPSSAAATGTLGEVRWDASYMYVCTATNTWKRSAIATW